MSEEVPDLKRDSTMAVTAKEGEAFLEEKGKVDEDAKTRLQQKQIEEVTEAESTSDEPKIERTTTMAETAKEGKELLDGAELGRTRGETAKQDESTNEADEKPAVHRATTMEATSEEAQKLLEKEGGLVEGTRSEAKQVEEAIQKSTEENTNGVDEEDELGKLKRKSTMAVTAEEGEEFIKRQKVAESEEAAAAKEVEA